MLLFISNKNIINFAHEKGSCYSQKKTHCIKNKFLTTKQHKSWIIKPVISQLVKLLMYKRKCFLRCNITKIIEYFFSDTHHSIEHAFEMMNTKKISAKMKVNLWLSNNRRRWNERKFIKILFFEHSYFRIMSALIRREIMISLLLPSIFWSFSSVCCYTIRELSLFIAVFFAKTFYCLTFLM